VEIEVGNRNDDVELPTLFLQLMMMTKAGAYVIALSATTKRMELIRLGRLGAWMIATVTKVLTIIHFHHPLNGESSV
jgi:hypothetical protein